MNKPWAIVRERTASVNVGRASRKRDRGKDGRAGDFVVKSGFGIPFGLSGRRPWRQDVILCFTEHCPKELLSRRRVPRRITELRLGECSVAGSNERDKYFHRSDGLSHARGLVLPRTCGIHARQKCALRFVIKVKLRTGRTVPCDTTNIYIHRLYRPLGA